MSSAPTFVGPSPTALPALDSTMGAIEVGVLVSVLLFGIVTCQSYTYFRRFTRDPIHIRCLVGTIWTLELGHTLAITHSLYRMTVSNFGNPYTLIKPPISLDVGVMFSAFIGPLVQAWFAYRVLRFSGQFYIPVICWFLSFLRCVATFTVAIAAIQAPSIVDFIHKWKWLLIFILTVGAAVDIIIAASLCFYLGRYKERGFRRTVKLINQLMLWTVETGLLTSVAAVSMLFCFLLMQDNLVWIAVFTFLAKLFSNSLLASLNARSLKATDGYPSELEAPSNCTFIDVPSNLSGSRESSKIRSSSLYPNIAIELTTTKSVINDDDISPVDREDGPPAPCAV